MLPTFLVIGAMKAGTSSLHRYLGRHRQVFMSTPKELDFFTAERNWSLGRHWYEQHFERADGAKAVGESSPSYALHPLFAGVPERIATLLPDARLIYVVRHPIERIRSQYLATYYLNRPGPGWDTDPIQREHEAIDEAIFARPCYYIDSSRYALQLEQYLEHFSLEQILVLTAEQLRSARAKTLRRAYEFIGVDAEWEDPDGQTEFNQTAGKRVRRPLVRAASRMPGYGTLAALAPQMLKRPLKQRLANHPVDERRAQISPDAESRLVATLREDIARLRAYMDEDFDGWGLC